MKKLFAAALVAVLASVAFTAAAQQGKPMRLTLNFLAGGPQELYGSPEESMVSRVMVKPVEAKVLLETIAELVG